MSYTNNISNPISGQTYRVGCFIGAEYNKGHIIDEALITPTFHIITRDWSVKCVLHLVNNRGKKAGYKTKVLHHQSLEEVCDILNMRYDFSLIY